MLKFVKLNSSQFDNLTLKNNDYIYFVEDTKEIYKGDVLYSNKICIVTTFPANGESNKLYVNLNSKEIKIYLGESWVTISQPTKITGITTDNNRLGDADTTISEKALLQEIRDLRENFVKTTPHTDLWTFLPGKEGFFMQSIEVVPDKNEIVMGCKKRGSAETEGPANIRIFDYYSKIFKREYTIQAYHCNDMAYNPNTKTICIATINSVTPEKDKYIEEFNYADMTLKRSIYFGKSVTGIAYNRDRNLYIVKTGTSVNTSVCDANFKVIRTFNVTQEATFQSIASKDDYIFYHFNSYVKVVDLYGREVRRYNFESYSNTESEGAAIGIDGALLLGQLDNKNPIDTPRIYRCDLTRPRDMRNLNENYSCPTANTLFHERFDMYWYITKEDGEWVIASHLDGGSNRFGAMSKQGNNYIGMEITSSAIYLKTRINLLNQLYGGFHLNSYSCTNTKSIGLGIISSLTVKTSEGYEIKFYDTINKTWVNPKTCVNGIGVRFGVSFAIPGY